MHYDTYLALSDNFISKLQWWIDNIEQVCRYITTTEPDLTIYSEVTGWGVTDKVNSREGFWHSEEIAHINVLKLKEIFYGIKTYCKNHVFKHVKVMCDTTTAISYINHMRGQKPEDCNLLAKEIWEWCIERNLKL